MGDIFKDLSYVGALLGGVAALVAVLVKHKNRD
jgi:hypothetical protein